KNADLGAIELLKAAGYDPQALLAMLQKVKAIEKKKAKAFSAHPSASKRIAYIEDNLDQGSVKSGKSSRLTRFKRFVSRPKN
ncbi:MAG: M48 family metalloprotease, partial [Candidatus Aminicenantes bacterium]|nr:M48 family metalloprotease [Candidatus Aminicenantes bacterium]